MYEAGFFTPYEIDSSKKLRFKGEEFELSSKPTFTPIGGDDNESDEEENSRTEVAHEMSDFDTQKEKKRGVVARLWDKLTNQF